MNTANDFEALIIRWLAGEASAAELQALDEWRRLSPDNEKQCRDRQTIWNESRRLAARSEVNVDAAWHRFQERIQPAPPAEKGISFFRRMAAIFVLVTGLAVAGWLVYRQSTPALQIASADSVLTRSLPDGSAITLNKAARISYPQRFRGITRRVTLEGEAFFDVKRDSSRPFVVEAGPLTITVLGTSFNINEQQGLTEVIVATGRVRVQRGGLSAELLPGDKLLAYDSLDHFLQTKETDKLYQYYSNKQFVCDNTPLWKLAEALEKAYGRRIRISNPAIRELRISTTFNEEPLENILAVVAQTFDIHVTKTNDEYVLE